MMSNIKELKKITSQLSVLYVEDDLELRLSTSEIFEGLFSKVYVATDGEEGLFLYNKYFKDNNKYIDIVLTDIQMPRMNGIDLSKNIFNINKSQKILIISAYDDKKYLLELINMDITGFMQKPLSIEQITSILYDSCNELSQEKELLRFIKLDEEFIWDTKYSVLSQSEFKVNITDVESKLLKMFTNQIDKNFSSLEIFEYIFSEEEKEFSLDTVKSMLKRLRKKLPENTIINTPNLGYCLKTT